MRLLKTLGVNLLILFCVSGCTPTVTHHGFNPENIDFTKIKVNITNRDQVMQLLGTPTITAILPVNGKKWQTEYYVQRVVSQRSFWKPKVDSQTIITIDFDDHGIVRKFNIDKSNKGLPIAVDKERTQSAGDKGTWWRSIMVSLGKVPMQRD